MIVDKLKEYKVAYRGLGEGRHLFNFLLDSSFFNCFDTTKGTEGQLKAEVEFIKSSLLMEVKIKVEGSVKAICDRCLSAVDLNIQGAMNLYVRQGTRDEGNDDDYIVLAPDDDFLDLSSYLYETYMLHYPIRVTHEEGQCDQGMEDTLDKYIIKEEDKPIDPRWADLQKLINN